MSADRHLRVSRRAFVRGGLYGAAVCASGGAALAQPPSGAAFRRLFTDETRQAIARGLTYLATHQNPDGSFGGGVYSRNVAICGLCGMAFQANGSVPGRGSFGSHLTRCVDFILRNCLPSGLISHGESASRGPMYGHGFATLFLAEVYGMARSEDLRGKLVKAVQLIVNTQNSEGGWRYEPRRTEADISVTVCQVMALRAARNAGLYVPNRTVDRATAYIERCQNPDGGFMYMASHPADSDFPRSAAAIVALYSAGIYEGEVIERGLAYLMQHPPRDSASGQQSYFMYGHYYAVQAMWHAGGRFWNAWYPAIRDVLLAQQESSDGSWKDAISSAYGTAMACLVLQMPSNYLPIFQR